MPQAHFCPGLLRQEVKHLFPFVTAESILDRSKADIFTKIFACIQSGWLVIQSIARVSAGLPITELELATMGFIFCASIMYILWWDKPFDVGHRTVIQFAYPRRFYASLQIWKSLPLTASPTRRVPDLKLIYSGKRSWKTEPLLYKFVFYGTALTFSALHIVAWNWSFPSPIIRTLWRSFSFAATAAVPIPLLVEFWSVPASLVGYIIYVSGVIYGISRLGLIVLIFYNFSSMPASVYETVKWTEFIPHFL